MNEGNYTFGELFKKYRLRSGFSTIREFGEALAQKGYIFEDSLFSHWQKNKRIPKDRKLILTIIKIFLEKKGIGSTGEINKFLESMNLGYLTEQEEENLSQTTNTFKKLISPKKILQFLSNTIKSKKLIRTGWKREKIKNPESVAEHSFQLSVIAMILADQFDLNKEKLIKMAVLHDLGELITGDLVYTRGKIIDEEKVKIKEESELKGIKNMFGIIGKSQEFEEIFKEMMERKSAEAKIFWQLDKLEMAIQAMCYEKENNKNLEEFFVTSELHIQNPYLRKILKEVMKERPKIK